MHTFYKILLTDFLKSTEPDVVIPASHNPRKSPSHLEGPGHESTLTKLCFHHWTYGPIFFLITISLLPQVFNIPSLQVNKGMALGRGLSSMPTERRLPEIAVHQFIDHMLSNSIGDGTLKKSSIRRLGKAFLKLSKAVGLTFYHNDPTLIQGSLAERKPDIVLVSTNGAQLDYGTELPRDSQ
ncbi:hypothetical protein BS47DRAFT_1488783, partial [Hydnum rufescens UP504]